VLEVFYVIEVAQGNTGAEYYPARVTSDKQTALGHYQVRKNVGSKVRLVECTVIEQSNPRGK
jgi:hypothetical protein